MTTTFPEPVIGHRSVLGEGPVWDEANQRIIWLDILSGEIHSFYPDSGQHTRFHTGQLTGAVALQKNGGLVAAMQHGFYEIDEASGSIRFIADPEAHLPDNRFNDGKCDPQGRFWAGTMHVPETEVTGHLYMLNPDGTFLTKASGIGCSNGLAWNQAADTMYYIDSPTRRVTAYDYEKETGSLSGERTIITIPEGGGFPDGMTIDAEGMLWIALWDGWKVVRYNPETGKQIGEISLPAARVTSCTFGGKDYADLYITTASTGLTDGQLAAQPLAGCLFVVRDIGVSGLKPELFGQ